LLDLAETIAAMGSIGEWVQIISADVPLFE